MRLTEEELKSLEPYEQNMRTALRSNYTRNPGRRALEKMNDIYSRVMGVRHRVNAGCNTCILNLLKDCGRIYFADKSETEARTSVEKETGDTGKSRISRVATQRIKGIGTRKKVPIKAEK